MVKKVEKNFVANVSKLKNPLTNLLVGEGYCSQVFQKQKSLYQMKKLSDVDRLS